jgi:hypothetical protein
MGHIKQEDLMLSPCQVAARMAVDVKTVYRWLWGKDLVGEFRQVGKSRRRIWTIWLTDLEDFIQVNR